MYIQIYVDMYIRICIYLDCYLIALKRYHGQDQSKKNPFNWGLINNFRGLVYEHHGREHGCSQVWQ